MAIPDSKELQNVGLKQWFSTLATHQKHLESFQNTVAKVPPQTSEVRIFPGANAAARIENHCTKLTGVPLLNSENSHPVLCSCLGRKGTNNCQPTGIPWLTGALKGYSRLCGNSSWSCAVLKWLSKWFSLPPPTLLSGNLPSLDPVLCHCHYLIT